MSIDNQRSSSGAINFAVRMRSGDHLGDQRQTVATRVGGRCSELSPLWVCRESVEPIFLSLSGIKGQVHPKMRISPWTCLCPR